VRGSAGVWTLWRPKTRPKSDVRGHAILSRVSGILTTGVED
jgi:hypothetical protein